MRFIRNRERTIRWIRIGVVVNALSCWSMAGLAFAQTTSQDYFNAGVLRGLQDVERRVETLERADLSGRLRVLESDMAEVKWLARGASGAVAGQLLIAGLGRRRSRLDLDPEG